MMACDICGKVGTSLTPLHDIYQTDDIKDICPDCEAIVNIQLNKIRDSHTQAQQSLLKRFMEILKGKS
jgi:hypothetical protein